MGGGRGGLSLSLSLYQNQQISASKVREERGKKRVRGGLGGDWTGIVEE